jgi:hypothetical protein
MKLPKLFHKESTRNPQEKEVHPGVQFELVMAKTERLEAKVDTLRLEWKDAQDKLMHLYDRVRKRQKALEDASGTTSPVEATPSTSLSRKDILNAYRRTNGPY